MRVAFKLSRELIANTGAIRRRRRGSRSLESVARKPLLLELQPSLQSFIMRLISSLGARATHMTEILPRANRKKRSSSLVTRFDKRFVGALFPRILTGRLHAVRNPRVLVSSTCRPRS